MNWNTQWTWWWTETRIEDDDELKIIFTRCGRRRVERGREGRKKGEWGVRGTVRVWRERGDRGRRLARGGGDKDGDREGGRERGELIKWKMLLWKREKREMFVSHESQHNAGLTLSRFWQQMDTRL
jgi:hypothetical protein